MSEVNAEAKNENSVELTNKEEQQNEEPPVSKGRKSTKRLSMLTRTAQEGEAILKGLGHKEDGGTEGRRTTRSSTRGSVTPISTPPPAKRERKAPSTGRGSRRGRPKKGEVEENEQANNIEEKSQNEGEKELNKTEVTPSEENGESQHDSSDEKKHEDEKMEVDSEVKEEPAVPVVNKEDVKDASSVTAPSSNITDNGPTQIDEKDSSENEVKPPVASPAKPAISAEEEKKSQSSGEEKNSEENKSSSEEKPIAPAAEPSVDEVKPQNNDIAAGEPASTQSAALSDEKSKESPTIIPSSIEQPTPAQ